MCVCEHRSGARVVIGDELIWVVVMCSGLRE